MIEFPAGGTTMPLRDHFRPPLDDFTAWDGFFGGWPAVIVQHLNRTLPATYAGEPRVHLAVKTEPPDTDEYEVRVSDVKRWRRLVAAVEVVSPANKDRPEHRRLFVAKCAALLQQRVAVTISAWRSPMLRHAVANSSAACS